MREVGSGQRGLLTSSTCVQGLSHVGGIELVGSISRYLGAVDRVGEWRDMTSL